MNQKFNNGQYVAFKNMFTMMSGKVDEAKSIGDSFKYNVLAVDHQNMVSTYEVMEKDIVALPSVSG